MTKKNIARLTNIDDDWIVYRSTCNCGCDNGAHIIIELDENGCFATTMYYPCHLAYWSTNVLKRIKIAFRVLMGWETMYEGECLYDKEGMRDLIDSLDFAYDQLVELELEKARQNDKD